jgi:hypothetical protein
MDLVSFETQQEYDWVKGFINGKIIIFLYFNFVIQIMYPDTDFKKSEIL